MKRRLFSTAALVMLVSASMTSVAFAADEVVFISPPTPKGDQTVAGGQEIKVQARVPGLLGLLPPEIDNITVTIKPRPGFKAGPAVTATQEGKDFSMAWDTRTRTPYNGGYDIEATAKTAGLNPKSYTSTIQNVLVNNSPATPSGVKAALEGSTVTVTWAANDELDLLSYTISRSVEGGSFAHLASVEAGKTLSYTDSTAPAGKPVKYQVAAVRRAASGDSGVVSDPANSSEVNIPAPPPPTQVNGQPVPLDAAGNPVAAPLPLAAPLAGPTMAPTLPVAKKAAPPPIYKLKPGEISFAETLPFDAPPPEEFEDAGEDSDLAGSTSLSDAFQATNPTKFILIGVVLLAASVFLFRTSRKILRADGGTMFADDFLAGADFSGLGDIELPPVPEAQYPTFKVFSD